MKKIVIFLSLCLAILFLSAFHQRRQAQEELASVHVMESDYPIYNDLYSLASSSDAIIRGGIEQQLPSEKIVPTGVQFGDLPERKVTELGFLITKAQVRITDVLKGSTALLNAPIVVIQGGGQKDGETYAMKDQPLSKSGDDVVFFLHQLDDGVYAIVGGPQGRFKIVNEILTSEAESPNVLRLPILKTLKQATWMSTKESLSGHPPSALLDIKNPVSTH
jgi:hypothetical protein